MPESVFPIRKWQMPEILFFIAACFAMGAVGFFIAVFLQSRSSGAGPYTNSQQVPGAMKERVIQQVSVTSLQPASAEVPRNQSDETDENADAKLKLLQKLNSSQ